MTAQHAPMPGQASLARRVSLTVVALLGAAMLAILAAITVFATATTRERQVSTLQDRVIAVAQTADAFDKSARVMVDRFFPVFKKEFEPSLGHNPKTGDLTNHHLSLTDDFTLPDGFTLATGAVATVFGRVGDDFKRITTSLKKDNGERAHGTLLDKAHPARALMLEGKPYVGRANLFGKPYMTRYEPVRDAAGQVVGALFIGVSIADFDAAVRGLAADARLYDSGGIVIIDPRRADADAVFVAHPEGAGRKVVELRPEAAGLLARLRQDPQSVVEDTAGLLQPSAGRWAVASPSKETGWWVVADVSAREVMSSHWKTMATAWALLSLLTVGIGVALLVLVQRWVGEPLKSLCAAAGAIARGDLSRPVSSDRRDEVGALMRELESMRRQLSHSIGQVRQAVESISTASGEIASGNADLSNRTEQTASNLQQAASSMEQLTGTVKQSAESARTANQLASSAAEVAARGGTVVDQVVATMGEIQSASKKIADIIGTIDGIAFQTNILALNAAVEAARAGEQGRGFAVVASEVRSLAGRSAEAAKQIKTLIGASVERVDSGSRLVTDAGHTMAEIVASVKRVNDMIGEITAAASEQSEGIGQINASVTQLDQMTQQNAALVEQSAAAAESLKDQAQRLAQAVQSFQLEPQH